MMIINSAYYKALRRFQQTNFPTKKIVVDAIEYFLKKHNDCFNGENGRHKNYEDIILSRKLYDAVCKIEYKLRGVFVTPKVVINLAVKEYAEELNKLGIEKYNGNVRENIFKDVIDHQ